MAFNTVTAPFAPSTDAQNFVSVGLGLGGMLAETWPC